MKSMIDGLKITRIVILILLVVYSMPNNAYPAPQMADYCYLPPFVTDANTPPNITWVYEKGSSMLKRAYSTTYNPSSDRTYYGFFQVYDPNNNNAPAYYSWDDTNKYFYKNSCTPSASNLNCIWGRVLNWALTSSVDVTRKAMVGFGWPDTGSGSGAGDVFTYTGNFLPNQTPITYGQWEDGNSTSVNVPIDIGGTNYYYTFCLSKYSGGNPTGLSVKVKSGGVPSCGGGQNVLITAGRVAMKFTDESRSGLIQKYADKDQDFVYDSDASRFSIRRWNNGTDKQIDIISNTTTTAERQTFFRDLLTAISKAPPNDPATPYLDSMMKDVVTYYQGGSATYIDNDSTTQTPYSWSTDTARACRKTFVLFMTPGENLNDTSVTPLTTTCTSGSNSTDLSQNTCFGYTTDLYSGDVSPSKKQNIRTYIVQTSFDANSLSTAATNTNKLAYAAAAGGGEYFLADDASQLESMLDSALLNIISSSSSASTVATLTSQTRESSTITQAYFYPQVQDSALRWIGYLRLLWSDAVANVREDTLDTAWLDLKNDKILSFFYDTSAIMYKARTYAAESTDPYSKIADCDPYATGNGTKNNDDISAIWNAQFKLRDRTTDDRMIKVGIGDTQGKVTSSICDANSGYCDFTTALDTTLQPFWNSGGYCSNNVNRWCAVNSTCNYCQANSSTRFCPNGTNDECKYCASNAAIACSSNLVCSDGSGGCTFVGAAVGSACDDGTGTCVEDDCYFNYGTCNTATLKCSDGSTASCSVLDAVCGTGGTCKGACTSEASRFCSTNDQCIDNFGSCSTDTCTVADGTTVKCNQECDADCAESVIKYVRGFDKPTPSGGQFRIRHECTADSQCLSGTCQADKTCSPTDNLKTYKLGDVVYSTPRMSPNSYVNGYNTMYGDDTYTSFVENRISSVTPIAIVGGNDGMVHAFKVGKIKDLEGLATAGTVTTAYAVARFAEDLSETPETLPPTDLGKELWGYIPYNVLPYLKWYCTKGYCHIPMLDARFTIADASINYSDPAEQKTAASWKRLLIGTMGIGGKEITLGNTTLSSSIFVLDITDPASPVLKWEKPLPDRSLTTAVPAIVRLGSTAATQKQEAGNWYLVIGSGPKSVLTNGVTYKSGEANVYVFNLKTGEEVATLPTGTTGIAVGDMMAVDFDSDYQVDDIYFGTYGGTGPSQKGDLYRLRLRNGESGYQTIPGNWTLSKVISVGRPIYGSPEVATDSDQNVWMYFGTGLYLTLDHAAATTDNEYLYGFKETKECWKGSGSCSTYSSFLDTTNINISGAKATELGCFCGGTQMTTFKCNPAGTCPATSCEHNKACRNNISKTCSLASDCPDPGDSCIENKVVLKVSGATLSGTGVPGACTGMQEQNAIGCLEKDIKAKNGWRRAITGQKMFARPFVGGGLVNYTSFEPTSTSCSLGGNTYLISLQYTTGTAYIQPSIQMYDGTYQTTPGSYSNLQIKTSVKLGTGVPPLGESLVALPLPGDAYKMVTQVSGGLTNSQVQSSQGAASGYVLWRPR